jgi:peptidoglycan/LPS O-acetylase OafA/YrhL
MTVNRYTFLDGVRGIAAIFVFTRHASDFWGWRPYRSYLAVDLFFLLSGFVIAYAYDERLRNKTMSTRQFLLTRLIRLYPVFLLSVVLSSIVMIGKSEMGTQEHPAFGEILGVFALTALFLPARMQGSVQLFPLNGPYWSLFYELVTNTLYALLVPILNTYTLAFIVAGSLVAISFGAVLHGNLDMGLYWGLASNAAGLFRSTFGIFLGLLIYRNTKFLTRYFGGLVSPWYGVLGMALVLATPMFARFNAEMDLLAVAVIFPLCLILASQDRPSRMDPVFLVLGSASYPIYVLHVPIIALISFSIAGRIGYFPPVGGAVLLAGIVALSVWIVKIYDLPARKWLSKRLLKRRGQQP